MCDAAVLMEALITLDVDGPSGQGTEAIRRAETQPVSSPARITFPRGAVRRYPHPSADSA